MYHLRLNEQLGGEQTSLLINALTVDMQPGWVPLVAEIKPHTGYQARSIECMHIKCKCI